MFKKYAKVIIVNILVVFIILELTCYLYWSLDYNKSGYRVVLINPYSLTLQSFDNSYRQWKRESLRPVAGSKYHKLPILWFGCSFAYGSGLANKDIGSYKLSELSKRPVYNRAFASGSINHMLYQLKDKAFYKEVSNDPEYIIYVWVDVQNIRNKYLNFIGSNRQNLEYEISNGTFRQVELNNFYKYIYFPYSLRVMSFYGVDSSDENEQYEYFEQAYLECMKEARKHFPNVKFVVLEYRESGDRYNYPIPKFEKLKKQGVTLIDTKELVGVDMSGTKFAIAKWDNHPSSLAWDLIIPKLVKKLKL